VRSDKMGPTAKRPGGRTGPGPLHFPGGSGTSYGSSRRRAWTAVCASNAYCGSTDDSRLVCWSSIGSQTGSEMLQRTWYAVQSAVGSALSVVLVMLQIIQWMMYLTVICFGCWTIYSGVRAIWCGSLVARLHGEWTVTLLSTSLRAASGQLHTK